MSGDQPNLSTARAVFDALGWDFWRDLNLKNDEHFQLVLQDLEAITSVNWRSCEDYDLARMRSLAAYYKAHKHNANWYEGLTVQKLLNWEPPLQQMAPPPTSYCTVEYCIQEGNDEPTTSRQITLSNAIRFYSIRYEIIRSNESILSRYPEETIGLHFRKNDFSDWYTPSDLRQKIEAVPPEYQHDGCPMYYICVNTPLISSNNDKMFRFFSNTKIKELEFDPETKLIKMPGMLSWTGLKNKTSGIEHVFWRECYSHALFSLIGGLQESHSSRKAEPALIVTGNQGTGKSVLGAIVALFLNQCFGWTVNYYGDGDTNCVMKPINDANASGKTADLYDLSSTSTHVYNSDNHILVFSSCNADRWKEIEGIRKLSIASGSYFFIEPFSKDELKQFAASMVSAKVLHFTEKQPFVSNHDILGGVIRYCFDSASDAQRNMEDAFARYEKSHLTDASTSLANWDDVKDQPTVVGKKDYPGMVLHVIPMGIERHEYTLQFASVWVEEEIRDHVRNVKAHDIEKILESFMYFEQSRGLAGVLFEMWMNVALNLRDFELRFIAKNLPIKSYSMTSILCLPTDLTENFTFENFGDMEQKLDGFVKSFTHKQTSSVAIGMAAKMNQDTIDGVLLCYYKSESTSEKLPGMRPFMDALATQTGIAWEKNTLILIGLQLTTARRDHPLLEEGVENLQACGAAIGAAKTFIWFVQPKKCLGKGYIRNQQALKFPNSTDTTGKRKQARPKQSNDQALWSENAREVSQMVAFCDIQPKTTPLEVADVADVAKKLSDDSKREAQKCNDALSAESHAIDLPARPREATIKAAYKLINYIRDDCPGLTGLADSLIDQLVKYDPSNENHYEGLQAADGPAQKKAKIVDNADSSNANSDNANDASSISTPNAEEK